MVPTFFKSYGYSPGFFVGSTYVFMGILCLRLGKTGIISDGFSSRGWGNIMSVRNPCE